MTNEKQNGPAASADKAAAGAGGGGQPPVDNPAANPPPKAPDAGDENDQEGEDEDLLDDDVDDYEALARADERLIPSLPTFSLHAAFMRSLGAMGNRQMAQDLAPWLRGVFDQLKAADMQPETAWRALVIDGAPIERWEHREPGDELPIVIFVAVARALIPIARAQAAAFELAVVTITGEDRLANIRQARAGRRRKRIDRLARRPKAARAFVERRKTNLATAALDGLKALAPKPSGDGGGRRDKKRK